jgi:DNA-binding NarL/FixJ family response regulator
VALTEINHDGVSAPEVQPINPGLNARALTDEHTAFLRLALKFHLPDAKPSSIKSILELTDEQLFGSLIGEETERDETAIVARQVKLTPYQQETLELVSKGLSNDEIRKASVLSDAKSVGAVENRNRSVRNELRARNNPHAVRIGFQIGKLVADRSDFPIPNADIEPKTERYVELLSLGHEQKEIAEELGYSVRTMENISRSAREEVGARNGSHLVRIFIVGGYLDLSTRT